MTRREAFLGAAACACAAACAGSAVGEPGLPDAAAPCAAGETRCEGTAFLTCADGRLQLAQSCPEVCDDALGCVACRPGSASCQGELSRVCLPDGSGTADVACDPVQGVTCAVATGRCEGPCAPDRIGTSYVGCDYYPTVTSNPARFFDDLVSFGVVVSNSTEEPAAITIEGGQLAAPITFTVGPADVQVQALPWVPALAWCNTTQTYCPYPGATRGGLVRGGGYRLRSTRPVTVYQLNPLDYTEGHGGTADASLLFPASAMTGRYVVASWPAALPSSTTGPGILAVTATEDGTEVTLTSRADTAPGAGAPVFRAGVPETLTLDRGDVLEVFVENGDLTGSAVEASRPVQVIGGNYCATIGAGACDHLEESIFPRETLGTRYVVTPPALPGHPAADAREVVRIIAVEPDTTLAYDPPQSAPTTLANAGDFVEIAGSAQSFQVTANHRILVAEYMAGGDSRWDTSMSVAVPTDQYRSSYLFHASLNYETSYVGVVAPLGAGISLDGTPLGGLTPVGATGYGVIHQELGAFDGGDHLITGDRPFGITVYGYAPNISYWYPGGLDLQLIP